MKLMREQILDLLRKVAKQTEFSLRRLFIEINDERLDQIPVRYAPM